MSLRRLLSVLGLLLALLAGAASGGWYWAATSFEDSWRAWIEARRADGYRFGEAQPAIGGFPLRVTARLQEPTVIAPQGWRWQGPPVAAEAAAWAPLQVRLRFPGRHLVDLSGREPFTVEAGSASGRLELAPAGPQRARAELGRVRVDGLPAGPVRLRRARLVLGPRHRASEAPAVDVTLAGHGVTLPQGIDTPLGRGLERLEVEATVEGRLPGGPPRAALAAWRRDGGVVEVRRLEVRWGPLALDGDGRLGLDEELRPLGAFSAEVRGLAAALDRLVAAGVVEPGPAQFAKVAVVALGRRDDATGETAIELTITLRDGRFYLGPVPLFRLSPVL